MKGVRPCEICGALIDENKGKDDHLAWHKRISDVFDLIADGFDDFASALGRGKKRG